MPPMSTMEELQELYDQISGGVKLTDWLMKVDPQPELRGQRAKQVKQLAQVDALINAKRQEKAKPERGIAASAPIMGPNFQCDGITDDGIPLFYLYDLREALQNKRDNLSRDMKIFTDGPESSMDESASMSSNFSAGYPEYVEMSKKLDSSVADIQLVQAEIDRRNRLHDLHTELKALQDKRDNLSRDMKIMWDRDGSESSKDESASMSSNLVDIGEYVEMSEKLDSVDAKIKIIEERIQRCHLADKGFGGNDVRRRLTGLAARFERHLRQ